MKYVKLMMGTSGWSYDEWVGPFYPSKETPKLTYYSGVFNTVEVDSSFYAMPNPKVVFGWVKHTPTNFKFSLKLPKTITHDMKLVGDGVEVELRKFFEVVSPLVSANKIGVVLAQLPPSLKQDLDLLERFLNLLPKEGVRFAIEFRHLSWWNRDTWRVLKKANVANTIVDEPLLPPELVVTAPFAYVRWHGRGERVWYDYRYSENEIRTWAKQLGKIRSSEVYGYWNNHFHANAVMNCLEMLEAVGAIGPHQKDVLQSIKQNMRPRKTLFDFQGSS
ncbi:MAG: DUF72 domain-containing protein [Nitrososphaerota archaeon]|nr:DUF72 domain-containing protein [Nitrososphaerota archaeon]